MKRLILCLFAVTVLAGCGGKATVDAQIRNRLAADVNAVKMAVNSQDQRGAETALATLNRDIASAQARGKLNPQEAGRILAASDRVAEDVRTFTPPPPPPQVTVTMPPPQQPQVPSDLGDEIRKRIQEKLKGKKHGNGNSDNGDG